MELWHFLKPFTSNFQDFENYFSDQDDIHQLKNDLNETLNRNCQIIISGKPGSGVTHLLHAICNKWGASGKKALYTTGQSIIYVLKKIGSEMERIKFKEYLLSFEMLAIDNLQFFYKKSVRFSRFIAELAEECRKIQKPLLFGCIDIKKDFTKSKKYSKLFSLKRINLKTSSSQNVFRILQNLCEHEEMIPDRLLYLISGYNGSIQQYVNCLVSIRFKSKAEGINLKSFSADELEKRFNIKNYFPRQQFRKGFISELPLWWGEVKSPERRNEALSSQQIYLRKH